MNGKPEDTKKQKSLIHALESDQQLLAEMKDATMTPAERLDKELARLDKPYREAQRLADQMNHLTTPIGRFLAAHDSIAHRMSVHLPRLPQYQIKIPDEFHQAAIAQRDSVARFASSIRAIELDPGLSDSLSRIADSWRPFQATLAATLQTLGEATRVADRQLPIIDVYGGIQEQVDWMSEVTSHFSNVDFERIEAVTGSDLGSGKLAEMALAHLEMSRSLGGGHEYVRRSAADMEAEAGVLAVRVGGVYRKDDRAPRLATLDLSWASENIRAHQRAAIELLAGHITVGSPGHIKLNLRELLRFLLRDLVAEDVVEAFVRRRESEGVDARRHGLRDNQGRPTQKARLSHLAEMHPDSNASPYLVVGGQTLRQHMDELSEGVHVIELRVDPYSECFAVSERTASFIELILVLANRG